MCEINVYKFIALRGYKFLIIFLEGLQNLVYFVHTHTHTHTRFHNAIIVRIV